MLHHIVLFKLHNPDEADKLTQRFLALKDECRNAAGEKYVVDLNGGLSNSPEGLEKGMTVGFHVLFKDAQDRDFYLTDPAHLRFWLMAKKRELFPAISFSLLPAKSSVYRKHINTMSQARDKPRQPSSSLQFTPEPLLYSFESTSDVSEALTQFIITAQDESLQKKDSFKVAISGGSLPKTLGQKLVGREGVKWEQWEVFFADERVVPLDHEDSNYRLNKEEIFDKVPIPAERIHPINVDLLDDVEELADDYEKQIMSSFAGKNSVARPRFDLVLLGMGPDGHTCSLFPGHELLKVEDRWVAYLEDSPKPPSTRITLTYPVLNHAFRAVFVATGAAKQEMMSRVFDDAQGEGASLPCARVKPLAPGKVHWFTDAAATGHLKYKKSEFKPQDATIISLKL